MKQWFLKMNKNGTGTLGKWDSIVNYIVLINRLDMQRLATCKNIYYKYVLS